jgi:uncharacterized OsmC-like protein
MKISASIKSTFNHYETIVQTNDNAKAIQIAVKASGYGSSVNGGELLMLSLATCFCNDIYREADRRKIPVSSVEVEVTGDFDAEGEPGSNFKYQANVTGDASQKEISDLVNYVDQIAEIHNTLRKGISVTLIK